MAFFLLSAYISTFICPFKLSILHSFFKITQFFCQEAFVMVMSVIVCPPFGEMMRSAVIVFYD